MMTQLKTALKFKIIMMLDFMWKWNTTPQQILPLHTQKGHVKTHAHAHAHAHDTDEDTYTGTDIVTKPKTKN